MSTTVVVALLSIGLLVGLLIGTIGIGGVLIVPALTYIGGMAIHVSIASAMVAYFFAGGVGSIEYARHGSLRWSDAAWLAVGAMPGAFIGAAAANSVPAYVLELLIAALIIGSALNSLRRRASAGREARTLARGALLAIGIVTGIGSSMSGTGGPLVLIPILLWMHVPVLAAVGLSQVIQVPISAFATAGNVVYGEIDVATAAALSVLLMVGVWFGARIAHGVSSVALKRFVSLMLLGVGVMMLARVAMNAAGGLGSIRVAQLELDRHRTAQVVEHRAVPVHRFPQPGEVGFARVAPDGDGAPYLAESGRNAVVAEESAAVHEALELHVDVFERDAEQRRVDPIRMLLTRRERHQHHFTRPRAACFTAECRGLIQDEAALSRHRLALEPGALPALGAHDAHRPGGVGIEPGPDTLDTGLQLGVGHHRLRALRVQAATIVPPRRAMRSSVRTARFVRAHAVRRTHLTPAGTLL